MSGQAHLSLSSVLSAQWCIKQQQRVKLQIKQFEVPYYVGGSWKTSHIVMYPWTCVRLFGVRRRVSGYPLSRDPLTKQKIMSKSPLFRLTSVLALDPSPLGITQSHNIIVFSRKTVSPTPFPSSTPQSCSRLCSFTRVSASWTSVGPNYLNYLYSMGKD